MAKEAQSATMFQKVFVSVFSAVMVSIGLGFITMQKNIATMSVQIDNQIKQLDNHIAKDKIVRAADVVAIIRDTKTKE